MERPDNYPQLRGQMSTIARWTDRYEIEEIIAEKFEHEFNRLILYYECKWSGYEDTTWEPEYHLDNCELILRKWNELKKSRNVH